MTDYLWTGPDWNMDLLKKTYDAIERIALEKYKLNVYPNQIEIISAEQMLDAYTSVGLPAMYPHWSFGKHFVQQHENYSRGYSGLAYEIVINSNPCISYLMENNSMTMQALVTSHAAFGHNHFFKNNYMFKDFTDAGYIIDYVNFARNYISECERKYGVERVESFLDSCHAIKDYGIDTVKRPRKLSKGEEYNRQKEREAFIQAHINELWGNNKLQTSTEDANKFKKNFLSGRESNIMYFLEKKAPFLETWQREILRIVRKISQYFYPQMMTKVMNEGTATLYHYQIINDLYDNGLMTDGSMQEFIKSHTGVVFQPSYNDPRYTGINPYYLGFNMFQDIQRMCLNPTEEDRRFLPDIAGNPDWNSIVLDIIEDFKDEEFVLQYLSPKLIRDMRLFSMQDDRESAFVNITDIHDDEGYHNIRKRLSQSYSFTTIRPIIEIVDIDIQGSRTLYLEHRMVDHKELDLKNAAQVVEHISKLWGFGVVLTSFDPTNDRRLVVYDTDDFR